MISCIEIRGKKLKRRISLDSCIRMKSIAFVCKSAFTTIIAANSWNYSIKNNNNIIKMGNKDLNDRFSCNYSDIVSNSFYSQLCLKIFTF